MMQEAPMMLATIGLLKRIEDNMVKVGVVFFSNFQAE